MGDASIAFRDIQFDFLILQMIEKERIAGVVSMNEDYELALFSHQSQGWSQLGVQFLQLSTTDIFQVLTCRAQLFIYNSLSRQVRV
jgi:hypothetical protein